MEFSQKLPETYLAIFVSDFVPVQLYGSANNCSIICGKAECNFSYKLISRVEVMIFGMIAFC